MPYRHPVRRRALVIALDVALLAFGHAAHAQESAPAAPANAAEALELPQVEVVGTTLLPGLAQPLKDVPANVQILNGRDLARQRQATLGDALEQNTAVTVNAAQGNPYQPDVSFRGFTASPLLGVPQGLSVFQDGVRINEPFGDTVNWDLLPQSAISSIQLIPGSNPVFGLNTLGGALAVYTKSGESNPGGALELQGGSFGRKSVTVEQGGHKGEWDWFVTGNLANDHGWAEHNPSRVHQFFGKVGYQTATTDIDVSLTAADNTLEGTQTLPASFSDNIRQAYTYPDRNNNKLGFLTVKGSHFVDDNTLVGGNVYYRKYRNSNFSSNLNDNFGEARGDGSVDTVQATNDRAAIDQDSYGLGLQVTLLNDLFRRKNQFVVGASADLGDARFTQQTQDAAFSADRGTVGTSPFAPTTDAKTANRYYGLFFTDTLSLTPLWALTASGRYNLAQVRIEDQSGTAPGLNGSHRFTRFNPALGLTFSPSKALTAYGSYSEGMRAPTAIELTCADPDAPCKLPNSFLSDPPLKKVVSKTVELGLRGKRGAAFSWSASVYRTELDDDIQFVSADAAATNSGYFRNVGQTRRQGLELSAADRFGPLGVALRYSYTDATYRSGFTETSPANSTADANGAIAVTPGSRIPGIPRNSLRLRLDYAATERWNVGANILASGTVFARGDENNRDARGEVPGYTLVNLDSSLRLGRDVELIGRVNNLFDRQYANFGVLGENWFNGPGRTYDNTAVTTEQFRGYGAPRAVWIGLRTTWK